RYLTRLPCLGRPLRVGEPYRENIETGEIRPMRCQRNGCPDCIGVNAWRRSLAVRFMKPTYELTLTTTDLHRCGDPWPQVQDRARVLRQAAKRCGVDLGVWGIYVEQGAKNGMTHAHIVVKDGQRLDFGWLRRRLESAGFGARFSYSAIKDDAGFAAYVGKGFASYASKGYRDDADEALRLNGGRVGHFSRGFFPSGVRRAEVQSLAAFSEAADEPSPWITRLWT
ncbi:hypothetical protein SAMN04487968_1362, partial [Nocardioides terrae]